MKKFLLISFIALMLIIFPVCASEEALTFEDFTYRILPDGSAEITAYAGIAGNVEIPEKIGETEVASIGKNAFSENESISSVTIPGSVISIAGHAFSGCISLKTVSFPDGLLFLGELAFQGDILLETAVLPASLVHIGMNPFDRCDKLSGISFTGVSNYYTAEDGVLFRSADDTLITYPTGKEDMLYAIPEGTTAIAYAAFSENPHLEEITIPNSVTEIEGNPFCGCTGLRKIGLDWTNQVFQIYSGSLFNIHEMELITYLWGKDADTYTVPNGTRSLAQESFYRHEELISVSLPDSLSTIKDAAFAESGLKEIVLPKNVTSLGDSTFSQCASLESVTLPSGFSWIGKYTFYKCEALASVTFPKALSSIGEGAFYLCSSLKELVFPEELRFIGDYAFLECSGVKTIDFPKRLYSIGRGAFHGITDPTVYADPKSLGEEWAQRNGITVIHKNVDYLFSDIV